MKIEFDFNKSQRNSIARQLPFEIVEEFDWKSAYYFEDRRKEYPEKRFIGMGYLGARLHVVCFTPIENGVRIISFRKANLREAKRYEKEKSD